MVNRFPAVAILASLSLISFDASAEIQLKGADGVALTLNAPATRVVTLAPDFAELVYDVGAGATLVGATDYSDHPEAAKKTPRVGDGFHVDVEKILTLKPDLVLVWQGGTPQALIEKLRSLKLPVLSIGSHTLPDIATNLEILGRATGHEVEAGKAAADYRTQLAGLEKQYASASPIRVFYEISPQPLFTVGGGQIISSLIQLCGGKNIFADLSALAPVVGMEAVLARDPQAIVTGDGEGDVAARFKQWQQWQQWPQLSAVRYQNLFAVDDGTISTATPRLLDAGRQVCEDLNASRKRLASKN